MMRIKNINAFLTRLDIYSTTLGGSTFVSSSIVLPVVSSLKKLLRQDPDDASYIVNMKNLIFKDFKSRIADNLNFEILVKCSALDPRFSRLKFVDKKEKRDEVFDELLYEARSLKRKSEAEVLGLGEQMTKKRKLALYFDESDDEEEAVRDDVKREVSQHKIKLRETIYYSI